MKNDMTLNNTSNVKGALFSLGAFSLYASHDVAVKMLGASYTTFQIIFFSVLLSFPLVVLTLMRDTQAGTLLPRHPWWIAMRTLSAIVAGLSVFYAFSVLPLAQVYTILFAMPLLITIMAIPVLGERVGFHRWAAVAVGLAGVLVVLRPGSAELSLGHAAALLGAFASAFGSVVVRKIGRDERSTVLILYPMMANFALMAVVLPFVYEPMPIEHLGLVALMALFAYIAALMLISAYKLADAAVVAPMQYSQIIWGALFGAIFFLETPDQMTWIGAGIVISSGLYIVVREAFGGTTKLSPVLRTRPRPVSASTPRPIHRITAPNTEDPPKT